MKIPQGIVLIGVLIGFAVAVDTVGVALAQETGKSGYKILQKVSLPGDGGWDYLRMDSDNRRLYVTHNNSVQVLDADTLKLVGTVENVSHPHGVAVLPGLGKGYVTSGDPGSVVVFDLKTLKRITEIPTAPDSDGILFDPSTKTVWAIDGDSGKISVIDPATDKVAATVEVGGKLESSASDEKGHVFASVEDKSKLAEIDVKTFKVLKRFSLTPGESPAGLAMDVKTGRLFSGCHNKKLVVVNAKNGKVVQDLPIGDHVDYIMFDPDSGTVFSSNGDGTLTVIHEDSPNKYTKVENTQTEPGARTMAFDSKTGRIFMPTAKLGEQPTPTKENPKPRRKIVPGTFHILVIGK